jgi:hypothetical protein
MQRQMISGLRTVAGAGLIAALACLALGGLSPARATLVDHGPNGEYFRDTDSGLFWWDPAQFVSMTKAQIDAFVAGDPNVKYATYLEIDDLMGKSSGGVPLTDVMGPGQFPLLAATTIGVLSGTGWKGFYDGNCPSGNAACPFGANGWNATTLLQGDPNPLADLSTIGFTGYQVSVDSFVRGAWTNSRIDPVAAAVPEPAAFGLFGLGLAGLGIAARRRKTH